MSFDTVTRVNEFFADNVATPNSLYTVYLDDNTNPPTNSGAGPWCEVETEASFDELVAQGPTTHTYKEHGLVTVSVFVDVGLGNKIPKALAKVVTLVRDAFRDKTILDTGPEEGCIYFESIDTSRSVTNDTKFNRKWKRKDIFINYQKNYKQTT